MRSFAGLILSALLVFGCTTSKTPAGITVGEVILMLKADNSDIVITNEDIEREIVVTADKAIGQDVEVLVELDVIKGVAMLYAGRLTIKAGEKSAAGKIRFNAVAFEGSENIHKITAKASTISSNACFEEGYDAICFTVSGEKTVVGDEEEAVLSVSLSSNGKSEFDTTDETVEVGLLFSIDRRLVSDLMIEPYFTALSTISEEAVSFEPENIAIAAGTLSTEAKLKVPKGTAGSVSLLFNLPKGVKSDLAAIDLSFKVRGGLPAPIALCKVTNSWGATAMISSFDVGGDPFDCSAVAPEESYFDLTAGEAWGFTDGDDLSVTLRNISKLSGSSYIVAAWVDWNRSGQLSDDECVLTKTVTLGKQRSDVAPVATAISVPADVPDGFYFMRMAAYSDTDSRLSGGCGRIEEGFVVDIALDLSW